MPKILPATADANGRVMALGVTGVMVEVPGAQVLSLGKQASSGLVFLDGDNAWYFPSSATDIETTLGHIGEALTKIASVLTSIGAGMTGPTTAPPPTLATDVAALTQIQGLINTLKGALK